MRLVPMVVALLVGEVVGAPRLAFARDPDLGGGSLSIGVGELPEAARPLLAPLQRRSRVELIRPQGGDVPARDVLLAPARRAYGTMEFRRAIAELGKAEATLIVDEVPSSARNERLAEVEVFFGACAFIARDPRTAEDRFSLAKALHPSVTADAIFPPEVAQALASVRASASMPVQLTVDPSDARVWVDGKRAPAPVQALGLGLHYLVVERADRVPRAMIVRVSRSSAQIELSASVPVTRDRARVALTDPGLEDREGLALSSLLDGPVWRLRWVNEAVEARRWSATDLARPVRTLTVPPADPSALEREVCAIDPCDRGRAKPVVPLRRRAWFWGVVGAGAAVVIGAVVAGAVVGTMPRDYQAVVR